MEIKAFLLNETYRLIQIIAVLHKNLPEKRFGEKGEKQARRHGGAFRDRAPPNDCLSPPNENCAPPSEVCAPKKLTGSELLECKSRPMTHNLVFTARIFVDSHRIS